MNRRQPIAIGGGGVSQRFYVLERMVAFTQRSETFRDLMQDLFAGIQGYHGLRSRFYRALPAVIAESVAGAIRPPWGGSGLAAGPFAE